MEGAVIGADSLVSYIMKSDVVQERDQLVDGTEGETVRSERHRTHRCRITDSDDDSATGAHHADELGEHPAGVLNEVDGIDGDGGVDGGVGKWQVGEVTRVEAESGAGDVPAEVTPRHGQGGVGQLDAMDVTVRTRAVQQRTEAHGASEADVSAYLPSFQPGCRHDGQDNSAVPAIQNAHNQPTGQAGRLPELVCNAGKCSVAKSHSVHRGTGSDAWHTSR